MTILASSSSVEQLNVDVDVVDPSWTIISEGCDAINLYRFLPMRFLYFPYFLSSFWNPATSIATFVFVPGVECISIFAAASQSKIGS